MLFLHLIDWIICNVSLIIQHYRPNIHSLYLIFQLISKSRYIAYDTHKAMSNFLENNLSYPKDSLRINLFLTDKAKIV